MSTYIYQESLQSKRLFTRFLKPDDVPAWAEFFGDKEAVEFFPDFGLTSNIEKARHTIDKQLDRYAQQRFGHQVLIDKTSHHFIGICGLLTQEVDGITETEVGYHVLKKYWGQGYAPEAAKLFIDYAFKHHLADSIISVIDLKNIKSQKVAEKNGLKIDKQTKWQSGEDVYIYRIYKDQWEEKTR